MYFTHLNIYFHCLLKANPRLVDKLSDSLLDFIFSLSIFNSITIYEHGYNSLTLFKSSI